MAYLLFFLALVALVAGLWLWNADERAGQAPAQAPDVAPEPQPMPEPEPQPEPMPQPEPAPKLEPQPTPELAPTPRPHRKSGLQLPGASRRERRAWADAHGFTFDKEDDLLAGEWQRGAAASGAQAKDVVSGQIYGHDTHLLELGNTTVIAMGTGEAAVVVIDMRREHFTAQSSADLVEVAREEGFTILATDPSPVRRFIDVRVSTALAEFPQAVSAVWCEGAWALAELAPGSTPADWDAALAPLALVADATRTLPPAHPRPLEQPFPGRAIPQATPAQAPTSELTPATPKVQRPDEPLQMPTRTTGTSRGSVGLHAIGGDEIAPIAAAPAQDELVPGERDLTRVRRKATPPSIFDDFDDFDDKEQ